VKLKREREREGDFKGERERAVGLGGGGFFQRKEEEEGKRREKKKI